MMRNRIGLTSNSVGFVPIVVPMFACGRDIVRVPTRSSITPELMGGFCVIQLFRFPATEKVTTAEKNKSKGGSWMKAISRSLSNEEQFAAEITLSKEFDVTTLDELNWTKGKLVRSTRSTPVNSTTCKSERDASREMKIGSISQAYFCCTNR